MVQLGNAPAGALRARRVRVSGLVALLALPAAACAGGFAVEAPSAAPVFLANNAAPARTVAYAAPVEAMAVSSLPAPLAQPIPLTGVEGDGVFGPRTELARHQKLGTPYQIEGTWYLPAHEPDYDETGVASWYGEAFHGRPTANGEVFDMNVPSAAHPTLPIPSMVEVTNLQNGRSITVRLNDRGPFVQSRIIDLSQKAAELLGYDRQGTAEVRVRYLGPAAPAGTAPATPVTPVVPEPLPVTRVAGGYGSAYAVSPEASAP